MIKISIKDDEIIIKGHANFDDYGKDIVCASVSSIAITTINAIVEFDNTSIEVENDSGYLKIDILKHSKEIDILISNMIKLFKELESKYKENIKIN
ncbi:MAG: ribosomal-processing cysteine protease Prp [Bacilli bacterium]|nr:ribosomal-processing cysteine protease Prp [Bacilli bacterium]